MLSPAADIEYSCETPSYAAEPVSLGDPTSAWSSNRPKGAARSGAVRTARVRRMMALASKAREGNHTTPQAPSREDTRPTSPCWLGPLTRHGRFVTLCLVRSICVLIIVLGMHAEFLS